MAVQTFSGPLAWHSRRMNVIAKSHLHKARSRARTFPFFFIFITTLNFDKMRAKWRKKRVRRLKRKRRKTRARSKHLTTTRSMVLDTSHNIRIMTIIRFSSTVWDYHSSLAFDGLEFLEAGTS
ncbi:hypothetical protein HYFRA_00005334 [Hymenoscyphus fraxineus]|uniref:60S ribosomal protein L41 n=1 Tax=Hymenoscyphus fraxineus TaxID=746836 RepID=A0A9N9LA68_9HELO|nr:hypothetical protein HYFRA_00005334 [Hymenoscyphus fraxineus]